MKVKESNKEAWEESHFELYNLLVSSFESRYVPWSETTWILKGFRVASTWEVPVEPREENDFFFAGLCGTELELWIHYSHGGYEIKAESEGNEICNPEMGKKEGRATGRDGC